MINNILDKRMSVLTADECEKIIEQLKKRLFIEFRKNDKSGIYGITQYTLAYNSNKIEGSRLSEDQTVALFETRTIEGEEYRAKDVEETTGHFLMFNHMLKTIDQNLTEELIKQFHYELKAGVFEDRANGYNIGEYKGRVNTVAGLKTVEPLKVSEEMAKLLEWYGKSEKNLETLALFHARYELIHPFQDGNGRTGRMILYRECLKNNIIPVILKDEQRNEYATALKELQVNGNSKNMTGCFEKAQEGYYEKLQEYLKEYKIEKKHNPVI